MINKAKIISILTGALVLFSIPVKAERNLFSLNDAKQTPPDNLQQIEKLIQNGEWQKAYVASNKILLSDSRSSIALFIRNTSRQILFMESKAGESLSIYSYPFSHITASQNLNRWIDSLCTADSLNINFLILKAAYQVLGKQAFEKAIVIFEKILTLDSNNVFVLVSSSAFYGGNGQSDNAKRLLERVIQLKPDCASAYTNLGMLAISENNSGKAEEYFKKATSFKSADAMDWFNLGSLYYLQKKYQKARVALDKSVLFSPDNVEAHYNLAGICYFLNDTQASIRHLKIIIKIGYNSPYYSSAKQNLEQLGVK